MLPRLLVRVVGVGFVLFQTLFCRYLRTMNVYEAIRQMKVLTDQGKTFSFSFMSYSIDKHKSHGIVTVEHAKLRAGNRKDRTRYNDYLLNFVDILQQELIAAGVLLETYDFEAHKRLVPMQPGDVVTTYADVSELVRDTGFRPQTSLRDGQRAFARWYRQFYGNDKEAAQ